MERIDEDTIRKVIAQVLAGMETTAEESIPMEEASGAGLPDLREIPIREKLYLKEPAEGESYLAMKRRTAARLGIGRSGCRYLTEPYLRFLADHAAARDAVISRVGEEFLADWGLPCFASRCADKDQFLTRPDLGRTVAEGDAARLAKEIGTDADVAIYISDGLSSSAVEANARDAYRSLTAGLEGRGLKISSPFFLGLGRVAAMDHVSEILKPKATVVLIGERPGLATSESLSIYLAYKASRYMPEARRTVLSNIHPDGTPAVEAGAQAAELVLKMLEKQASGVELTG